MEELKQKRASDSDWITREYLDSLLVEMRLLDSNFPSTELQLFGEKFSTPVMMAALSHLDSCYPDGMVAMAQGAAAAGAVMWAGMGEEKELERILQTGAKTIKIIKPYADEAKIYQKIQHAEAQGAFAVGIDIDHAYNRSGGPDVVLGYQMSPKSLKEIQGYVKSTKLPFIIKGVLSVQDAQKCMQAGVKGIVVSHHHGIMEYAVPPLQILPEIKEAVKGQMVVFADCGFVSGMDIYKGMALGADAISVGRKIMEYLHTDGAKGVEQAIKELTKELAGVMARTNVKTLEEFDSSVLWEKETGRRK